MSKVAVLIDGGYFLKRLPSLRPSTDVGDPKAVIEDMRKLVWAHLRDINNFECKQHAASLLYRVFFYDAQPYSKREHRPISNHSIDFQKTPEAIFRTSLHKLLRVQDDMAVRLGEVRRDSAFAWELKSHVLKALLKKERDFSDLNDEDFRPTLRQKAVDMRIGLDIASITLKRQANFIVLIAGDSDFTPAAKLARREGVKFILDPLWRKVDDGLFEHIDRLRNGFPNPEKAAQDKRDL